MDRYWDLRARQSIRRSVLVRELTESGQLHSLDARQQIAEDDHKQHDEVMNLLSDA